MAAVGTETTTSMTAAATTIVGGFDLHNGVGDSGHPSLDRPRRPTVRWARGGRHRRRSSGIGDFFGFRSSSHGRKWRQRNILVVFRPYKMSSDVVMVVS
ncbi:unnamed protein product [Lactuca virosa]|uniref:Uncharacterized protein n=1 Tax=Lactuca virosa TaxID=75947 RepID=A0AAU9PN25_9ASTR|nr:unnamed protein product [Lactuca virosa]